MEPINSPLLTLAETFGTRNQEYALSEVIQPTFDATGEALANLRLVGADSPNSAVIAAGSTANVSITVLQDTYLTGAWILEPGTNALDNCMLLDAFWQRNQSGTFAQVAALRISDRMLLGSGLTTLRRAKPLYPLPFGILARAGDLFSATVVNLGAAATTTGFLIAYRGLSAPPG